MLTGYQTDWRGECEIAAYEYGTGMGKYWVAWVINLVALLMGVFLCPKRTWAAFKRGRHSQSIYKGLTVEALLEMEITFYKNHEES